MKGLFLGKNAVDEWKKEEFFDLVLFVSGGALLGAHLGYIMLYGYPFFASSSFLDFLPIDRNGTWRGISGMSFHGGVVGGVIGIFYLLGGGAKIGKLSRIPLRSRFQSLSFLGEWEIFSRVSFSVA
ncbi:MAG: prolipoprotein diacylglyceryl transferase [Candidatus Moraniibacteriota bacterium]|nr:MAG: prolipoprotein diacylglyceryl transferase [Candidatus Moranbacteria bacterium]